MKSTNKKVGLKLSNYKQRKLKTLKQILSNEQKVISNLPVTFPSYSNVAVGPSILVKKKYCDLTGLEAKYTDPVSKLRYFSKHEYRIIRSMSVMQTQLYLEARKAQVVLK